MCLSSLISETSHFYIKSTPKPITITVPRLIFNNGTSCGEVRNLAFISTSGHLMGEEVCGIGDSMVSCSFLSRRYPAVAAGCCEMMHFSVLK